MPPLRIIAFTDGRPGHEKQTRGILQALAALTSVQVDFRSVEHLTLSTALRQWTAYAGYKTGLRPKPRLSGFPDLVLGTGSYTHIPLLLLAKACRVPAVTCMRPALPLVWEMDLCCVPRHDRPAAAANIFLTSGPPNLCTYGAAHDPNKRLILVGGRDEKSHHWTTGPLLSRIRRLVERSPAQSAWTIATSPRTPRNTAEQLDALCRTRTDLSFFPAAATPPGWIETAYSRHRTVWVTADSISMVYEALTAGCRVGILPVQWKRADNKFQAGLDYLARNGYVLPFEQWLAGRQDPPAPPRLDEADRCAREILRRWWPMRLDGKSCESN